MSENEETGDFNQPPYFGDLASFPKTLTDSQLFKPLSSTSLSSEYKISLPSSMETQIRKLKLSLEPWRELILLGNDVLLWEQFYYAYALVAGTTIIFGAIWFSQPTILTLIALIGLTATIGDYLLPIILSSIFKPEAWTMDKQREYEEICTSIILYKTKAELLVSSYCRMRVTNSKMYYGVTISSLCFLIWLGDVVDNLLLTYLVTLFLVLLPGLQYHGMLNKFSSSFTKLFNELVENAKAKVGQKKSQ